MFIYWFLEKRHISQWFKGNRSNTFIQKSWSLWQSQLPTVGNEYIELFLPKVITGFPKSHNTQYSLLKMLENFKEALEKDYSVIAFFIDLSKTFDALNQDLLISKLHANSFSGKSFST